MKQVADFYKGAGKKMDGGFFQRAAQYAHSAAESSFLVPAGYAAATVAGTSPVWVQNLTGAFELVAVIFAVLVGATTFYINVINILDKREKKKRVKQRAIRRSN